MVLGEKKWTADFTCKWIRHEHVDHLKFMHQKCLDSSSITTALAQRWLAPPLSCVTLNVDGACRASHKMGGMVDSG